MVGPTEGFLGRAHLPPMIAMLLGLISCGVAFEFRWRRMAPHGGQTAPIPRSASRKVSGPNLARAILSAASPMRSRSALSSARRRS